MNLNQIEIKCMCLTMLLLPDRLLLPPRLEELPCFCWPPLPPFWADRELLESKLWCLLSATGIVSCNFSYFLFIKTQSYALIGFPYCTRKIPRQFPFSKFKWRYTKSKKMVTAIFHIAHFNFISNICTDIKIVFLPTLWHSNSWAHINPIHSLLKCYRM